MADYGKRTPMIGGADFGDPANNLSQAIKSGKVPVWMKDVTYIRAFVTLPEQQEWERRFDYIPLPEWCYEEYSGQTQFLSNDGTVVHQMSNEEWASLLEVMKQGHMLKQPDGNMNSVIIPPNAVTMTPAMLKRTDGWIDYSGPMGLRYIGWGISWN